MLKMENQYRVSWMARCAAMVFLLIPVMAGALEISGTGSSGYGTAVYRQVAPLPPAPWEAYTENVVDLRVKVLGGHVAATRSYFNKQWHFNREWNPIVFLPNDPERMIIKRNDLDFVSPPLSQLLDSALPDGEVVEFVLVRRLAEGYPFESRMKFWVKGTKSGATITPTQFRWEDGSGNWIEYEPFLLPDQINSVSARVSAYGDSNDVRVTIQYDAAGRRSGVFDHLGNQVLWFEYHPNGKLKRVWDADNREVSYSLDGATFIDVRGNTWSYTYEVTASPYEDYLGDLRLLETLTDPYTQQVGQVKTKTDPENRTWTLTYNSRGSLSTMLDAKNIGIRRSYNYDRNTGQYAVLSRSGASSGGTEIAYDKYNRRTRKDVNGIAVETIRFSTGGTGTVIKTVTDWNGHVTSEYFDRYGNLSKRVYPDNSYIEYKREQKYNKVKQYRDALGVITDYDYDPNGNLIKLTEAAGRPEERITEYTYDQYGNRKTVKYVADAKTAEAIWQYDYDLKGNNTKITSPEGSITTHTAFDIMGNVLSTTDARSKVWGYTYDLAGNMRTSTDPLQHTTAYDYDKVGNRSQVTDANNKITSFEYNTRNQVIKTTNPENGVTLVEYDADGQVLSVEDPDKIITTRAYDNEQRPITTTDGASNQTVMIYPAAPGVGIGSYNQPVRVRYPTYDVELVYDQRRRVAAQKVIADGKTLTTQYTYDDAGRVTLVTDPKGNATTYEYDAFGNVTKEIDAKNGEVLYEYDDRNNLLSLTDPEIQKTSWTYDRDNRKKTETKPLGETHAYDYDGNGNLISLIDAKNQELTYAYDDAGRLDAISEFAVSSDTTPQKTIDYAFDSVGNLQSWTDGVNNASYTYSGLNRQLTQTVNYGTVALNTAYTYYPSGRKKTLSVPGASVATYGYDQAGRITSVQIPGQGSIAINERRWTAISKMTYPGGGTQEVLRNDLLLPDSITGKDPASNVSSTIAYTYDDVQNILSKTTDDQADAYGYDELYRLTSADYADGSQEAFGYDGVGNRTGYGADTWGYNANNQLIAAPVKTYEYDDNGSLTVKRENGAIVSSYHYNIRNRLVQIDDQAGSTVATYAYDPLGRRLSKTVGGTKTYFLYTDEGMIGEFDSTGNVQVSYGFLPDGLWGTNPLYQIRDGNYYYYYNDHLGTPVKMVAASGEVVWKATSQAFGQTEVDPVSQITNNLRFPGQYYDAESGLHYNYFRYYDAGMGRYVSSDPIGLLGGINTFSYAGTDPLWFIDPVGLEATGKKIDEAGKNSPPPPTYDPAFWSDPDIRRNNNCYSYAADRPFRDFMSSSSQKPQPGSFSGTTSILPTCQAMRDAAKRDGFKDPIGDPMDCGSKCEMGYHKVYLVTTTFYDDYHWYRQDQGGGWSHKRGITSVTNRDASGNPISCPANADRNYGMPDLYDGNRSNYSVDCGVMCAPSRK